MINYDDLIILKIAGKSTLILNISYIVINR